MTRKATSVSTSARSFRAAAVKVSEKQKQVRELPEGPELTEGWLTQFGIDQFREQPRFEMEFDVSTLLGRLTLKETTLAVLGRSPKPEHNHRFFEVEMLTAAEYRCLHTASRRNPQHASILAACPDNDIESHRTWWGDPKRVKLHLLAESGV